MPQKEEDYATIGKAMDKVMEAHGMLKGMMSGGSHEKSNNEYSRADNDTKDHARGENYKGYNLEEKYSKLM